MAASFLIATETMPPAVLFLQFIGNATRFARVACAVKFAAAMTAIGLKLLGNMFVDF